MIKIGIIGAGHWGPNLVRSFRDSDRSEVHRVVDTNESRLRELGARFRGISLSQDPDDVFDDKSVDAVVIASPTRTHSDLVRRALSSGKHVLVEKPLTTSVRDGAELCELAEQRGLRLMVGHIFLYNDGVRRVRQLLDEKALGLVYYISMVRTNLGPIRMDVNAAWDLASHDVSIANYWLGGPPVSVSAFGGSWINEGLEDTIFATFRYPHNVIMNVHASWLNPRKSREITVVGDHSMLTFDDLNLAEPIRIFDKRVTDSRTTPGFMDDFSSFRTSVRQGDVVIPYVPMGEPLRVECEHFLDCILNEQEALTSGRSALDVVRALEALQASIESRGCEQAVQ
jgi:predicted dehydrogenase